jgi:hypothetical protein
LAGIAHQRRHDVRLQAVWVDIWGVCSEDLVFRDVPCWKESQSYDTYCRNVQTAICLRNVSDLVSA